MQILFSKQFRKRYSKLKAAERARCNKRLKLFAHNPFDATLNNHPLGGAYKKYRSINMTGGLRALYEPVRKDAAYFINIGTHAELYE